MWSKYEMPKNFYLALQIKYLSTSDVAWSAVESLQVTQSVSLFLEGWGDTAGRMPSSGSSAAPQLHVGDGAGASLNVLNT